MHRNNRVEGLEGVDFFRYAMLFCLAVLTLVVLLYDGCAHAEVAVSITGAELSGQEVSVGDTKGLAVDVRLPFDEEYGIVLDNKDQDRRALVNIRIDGRAVTGDGLILRAGERITLERFIDSGSLTRGKRFKFVPKTDEPLRRENDEDGMIAVIVQYEKSKKPLVRYADPLVFNYNTPAIEPFRIISDSFSLTVNTSALLTNKINTSASYEKGVTVEGSESNQRFQKEEIGKLDEGKDKLVISLQGYYKTQPILIRR